MNWTGLKDIRTGKPFPPDVILEHLEGMRDDFAEELSERRHELEQFACPAEDCSLCHKWTDCGREWLADRIYDLETSIYELDNDMEELRQ